MNINEIKNGNVLVFKGEHGIEKYIHIDGEYYDKNMIISVEVYNWLQEYGLCEDEYKNLKLLGIYKSPRCLMSETLRNFEILWEPTDWSKVAKGTPVLVWDNGHDEMFLRFFKNKNDYGFITYTFIKGDLASPILTGIEGCNLVHWDNCKLLEL